MQFNLLLLKKTEVYNTKTKSEDADQLQIPLGFIHLLNPIGSLVWSESLLFWKDHKDLTRKICRLLTSSQI